MSWDYVKKGTRKIIILCAIKFSLALKLLLLSRKCRLILSSKSKALLCTLLQTNMKCSFPVSAYTFFFLPATLSPLNQLLRRIEALLITAPVSSVAARLSISPNIIQSLTKLRRARFTSFFGPRSLRFQFKIFDRRRLLLFANAYVGVRPVENTNTSMCARSAHNFARLVR